jgi:hypothetical protein
MRSSGFFVKFLICFLTGLPILPFPPSPFGNWSIQEPIDPPSDRIFRGWELDPHEFPWMVKLMVRNNFNIITFKPDSILSIQRKSRFKCRIRYQKFAYSARVLYFRVEWILQPNNCSIFVKKKFNHRI